MLSPLLYVLRSEYQKSAEVEIFKIIWALGWRRSLSKNKAKQNKLQIFYRFPFSASKDQVKN